MILDVNWVAGESIRTILESSYWTKIMMVPTGETWQGPFERSNGD